MDLNKKYRKKTLWGITAPVGGYMWTSIVVSILSSVFLVASILMMSLWLGSKIGGSAGFTMDFTKFMLTLAFVSAMSFVLRFLSFGISHKGAFKLERILRNDLSEHMSRLPLGVITSRGSGFFKKVILDDVRTLHAFVADSVPTLGKVYFMPFFVLVILFWLNYLMALGTLLIVILGFATMSFMMKDYKEMREAYTNAQADVNKSLIEFIQAMPIVRIFDDGADSFRSFEASILSFTGFIRRWAAATRVPALMSMAIMGTLPTLIINLIIGALLLRSGQIQYFNFIGSIFLCGIVSETFMSIMWLSMFIRKADASSKTIHSVLSEKPLTAPTDPKKAQNFTAEFENVGFAYDERQVLKNVSFKAEPGTVTALVGPSGAGKTTVAKLLARFWDVDEGLIKIGGVDIRQMDPEDLMNCVSFVFQENYLFNDSILNNILLANDSATKEDVVEAAKLAQIHESIMSLENGYETIVSDRGTSLSGGERQRVTIARMILRDSPIVILDEATAFADTENESRIFEGLRKIFKDKTVIIIAHRLSTIQNADQILVINSGEIAERGRHSELLENQSIYSQLWQNHLEAANWNLDQRAFEESGMQQAGAR